MENTNLTINELALVKSWWLVCLKCKISIPHDDVHPSGFDSGNDPDFKGVDLGCKCINCDGLMMWE